jgi:hypothetical protein
MFGQQEYGQYKEHASQNSLNVCSYVTLAYFGCSV